MTHMGYQQLPVQLLLPSLAGDALPCRNDHCHHNSNRDHSNIDSSNLHSSCPYACEDQYGVQQSQCMMQYQLLLMAKIWCTAVDNF